METDLKSLFGLHVHSCTALAEDWDPPPHPPPVFGLIYEDAIGHISLWQPGDTQLPLPPSFQRPSADYSQHHYDNF